MINETEIGSSTYEVAVIFDDQKNGRVDSKHLAIQRLQTEAVLIRTVDELPRTTLGTRRQVKAQLQQHMKASSHHLMLIPPDSSKGKMNKLDNINEDIRRLELKM